jgi:hypothetical protein
MNRFVDRRLIARDSDGIGRAPGLLNPLINILVRCGVLKEDLDYHVLRGAMVIIFFFFGYQKWWAYEAERLIPYISHGPLIFWLYPTFGLRGASWFFGLLRMDVRHAAVARVLEQEIGHTRHPRLVSHDLKPSNKKAPREGGSTAGQRAWAGARIKHAKRLKHDQPHCSYQKEGWTKHPP